MNKPGYYQGRHYSAYLNTLQELKKANQNDHLEMLLYHLVDATEAESQANRSVVAPHYYEELAILYRKQHEDAKELAILERYVQHLHKQGKLTERLEKVRDRIKKKV